MLMWQLLRLSLIFEVARERDISHVFVSHLYIALDLVQYYTRIHWKKVLSPQNVRLDVIHTVLQAEVKLIWVLFTCCCFI